MIVSSVAEMSFSEKAYFYHVYGGRRLSRKTVNSLCNQACTGNTAYWIGALRTVSPVNLSVKYSLKIFKTEFFPSYLSITDKYRKAFQLLWFLSSFVASCKDVDVKPIVYCKS